MSHVTKRTFETYDTPQKEKYLAEALSDLQTRVQRLWVANTHAIDVIQARDALKAAALRITSAKGRTNVTLLGNFFQTLDSVNTQVLALERKYLSDSRTKAGDALLQRIAGISKTVVDAQASNRQVMQLLTSIYDTHGSNREIIAGVNACRIYVNSSEELLSKISALESKTHEGLDAGVDVSDLTRIVNMLQASVDAETARINAHVQRMRTLLRRFDVKKSTIKEAHTFQQWMPRVERRLGSRYPTLAARVNSILLLGTKPFPDPITEIVIGLRATGIPVDVKTVLCAIIHDNVLELSKSLPPVCDTLMDAHHGDDVGLGSQVEDVYEQLLNYISASRRPELTTPVKTELVKGLLASKAAIKSNYATKLKAWCTSYLKDFAW